MRNICCLVAGLVGLAAPLLVSSTSWAETPPSTNIIGQKQIAEISDWLKNNVVEISISAQNKRHAEISQDDIIKLDKQWRAERKSDDQPLIAAVLSSPLSSYLTQIQAASGGLFTEIFVMDNKGLNVGQSSITSDYWQGDEGKFQKTYPKGAKGLFIDEAEFHKGTKTWRAQVNMTVNNNKGTPIGAVTVEYNLTELSRRLAKQ